MVAPLGLACLERPLAGRGAPERNVVRVTELGRALLRWRTNGLVRENCRVIARHGARALAAAQLRNPLGESDDYPQGCTAFPFAYIWRALLALDLRISPEEMNRALFHAMDEDGLAEAIERIRAFRAGGPAEGMGEEVAQGDKKNDRIGIWMARASFGWTLVPKMQRGRRGGANYWELVEPWAIRTLREVAAARHRPREFASEREYVEHLSACAGLPPNRRDAA